MSEAIALRMCWHLHPCTTPQRPLCLFLLRDVAALPQASFAALTAALSVELDVQSTIPFNDQDEDVQVEIVLTLSRMVA